MSDDRACYLSYRMTMEPRAAITGRAGLAPVSTSSLAVAQLAARQQRCKDAQR